MLFGQGCATQNDTQRYAGHTPSLYLHTTLFCAQTTQQTQFFRGHNFQIRKVKQDFQSLHPHSQLSPGGRTSGASEPKHSVG